MFCLYLTRLITEKSKYKIKYTDLCFLPDRISKNASVYALAFSPSDSLLAAGLANGKSVVFDYKTGAYQKFFGLSDYAVTSLKLHLKQV